MWKTERRARMRLVLKYAVAVKSASPNPLKNNQPCTVRGKPRVPNIWFRKIVISSEQAGKIVSVPILHSSDYTIICTSGSLRSNSRTMKRDENKDGKNGATERKYYQLQPVHHQRSSVSSQSLNPSWYSRCIMLRITSGPFGVKPTSLVCFDVKLLLDTESRTNWSAEVVIRLMRSKPLSDIFLSSIIQWSEGASSLHVNWFQRTGQ